MVVKCIDISHYQGFPDFEQVADAGVLAMIHKATEGTGYSDPNRGRNCKAAMDAGLAISTYHFLRPGSMNAQMDFYVNTVDPVEGERMILDHEDAGVSVNDLCDCVRRLQSKGRNLQITVYSGHVLKEQLGNSCNMFLRDNTDLWIAHYGVSTPTWPKGTYANWSLWQYSDTGTVPGISDAKVDLNNFNGSDENLLKWMGPISGVEPPPVEAVATVTIDIDVEGAPVRIIVNGQEI